MTTAMDCPPDVFFTEASFERYALQPTLQELLEKYAPVNTPLQTTGKTTGKPTKSDRGYVIIANANYFHWVCSEILWWAGLSNWNL